MAMCEAFCTADSIIVNPKEREMEIGMDRRDGNFLNVAYRVLAGKWANKLNSFTFR